MTSATFDHLDRLTDAEVDGLIDWCDGIVRDGHWNRDLFVAIRDVLSTEWLRRRREEPPAPVTLSLPMIEDLSASERKDLLALFDQLRRETEEGDDAMPELVPFYRALAEALR